MARGVAARQPGDVYVKIEDSSHTLTIIEIIFARPSDGYSFDTRQELEGELDFIIPRQAVRIHDNTPTEQTCAAIVAHVENQNGEPEYHVRYLFDLRTSSGKWRTLKGFQYQKGVEGESLPIKPSDLIPDERLRNLDAMIETVHSNLNDKLRDSEHAHMIPLIEQVLSNAEGSNKSIEFEDRSQAKIIAKYAGEYAGIVALMNDNIQNTSLSALEQRYNVDGLGFAQVMFPQDTAAMLVDSYISVDDTKIGVSSKIFKNGGAASSLLGIYDLMSEEVMSQYPVGAKIVEDFSTLPAFSSDPKRVDSIGPIRLAYDMNVITDCDLLELQSLDRNEKNASVLKSPRLKQIVSNQGLQSGTLDNEDYSVYLHALSAIVNLLVTRVNHEPEFAGVVNAVLKDIGYLQLLTKTSLEGNNVTFTYHAKLPDYNQPFVFNKTYFATGNKGRIGFKMQK